MPVLRIAGPPRASGGLGSPLPYGPSAVSGFTGFVARVVSLAF